MPIDRRTVLKGIALSSVASVVMDPLAHASSTDFPAQTRILSLVDKDDPAGSLFLEALESAGFPAKPRVIGDELADILALERYFREHRGTQVLGLLNDAAGTLVVDIARGAGARILWLGQHAADANGTRHHLIHGRTAAHCGRLLAEQLRACGNSFYISEQTQGDRALRYRWHAQERAAQSSSWIHALARLMIGRDRPSDFELPVPTDAAALDGRFVSFVIAA
jgi:hypothetical protein